MIPAINSKKFLTLKNVGSVENSAQSFDLIDACDRRAMVVNAPGGYSLFSYLHLSLSVNYLKHVSRY